MLQWCYVFSIVDCSGSGSVFTIGENNPDVDLAISGISSRATGALGEIG
jgi:hypothetical protein